MADISRLSRLLDGIQRQVNLATNSLVMQSLKLTDDGGSTSSELTKTILDNLLTLQDGSDISASLHHHDGRYFTETELGSNANGEGASLIGIEDASAQFTATNVEGALDEALDAAQAAQSDIDDHIADATDAHAASAITNTPAGDIAATTVQAAIDELDSEKASSADLASTANGEGASLIGIEDAAGQYTATDVEGALTESLDAAQAAQADIDGHLDGGANKHDASEIDVEGSYTDISTGDLETAISDIDTALQARAESADLASTANGLGASLIGVEDSAANFAGADVEAVLAELQTNINSSAAGINMKDAVRAASTAAGTLASDFEDGDSMDGITLATGDRILIKDQASAAENGIYVVQASGAPVRASDFDGNPSGEVQGGNLVYVQEGTANANTQFILQGNADNKTVGTDPLNFSIFSRAEAIVNGDGLDKSGLTLSVDVSDIAGDGLEDDGSNNLRIAASVAGTGLAYAAGVLNVNAGGGLEVSGDQVQLAAGVAGNGIQLAAGVLSIDFTEFDSDDITEGSTNEFYTEAKVSANVDVAANTAARHDALTLNAGDATQQSANLSGQELELVQATASTDGVMSAEDKAKLDGIEAGATADQSAAEVSYSNGSSGLTATDVQAAIDEVEARIDTIEAAPSASVEEDFDAGETLTAGVRAVRLRKAADAGGTDGRVHLADNDASAADDFHVIGLLVAAGETAGTSVTITKMGSLTATSHGLTVGEPFYLGASGAVTSTAPSAVDEAVVKLGMVRDANTLEVQIQIMGVN